MKPYYEHAGITIYHGDCREILPTLPKADLVLTDPPYGLAMSGGTWGRKMDATYAKWDSESFKEWDIIFTASTNQIVWGGQYFVLPPSRGWLIWKKPTFPTMADAELAWTSFDMNTKLFESTRSPDGRQLHPTQKPINLMTWCLSFAVDAQTILDPFIGSGTTLRAAKDLGRKAIGIEIEEKYCEIAAHRMQQEVFAL